jgi:hypothetical protein
MRCPECGLAITPRAAALVPAHCPRCRVLRRAVVMLELPSSR